LDKSDFKGEIAMAYARLADIQVTNGLNSLDNNAAGDKSAAKALALFEQSQANPPADPLYYLWWSRALGSKAFLLRNEGKVDEAIALLSRGRSALQRGLALAPKNIDLRADLGSVVFRLGQMRYTVVLANKGQPDEALRDFDESLAIYAALPTKEDKKEDAAIYAFQSGTVEGAKALVYAGIGRLPESIAHSHSAVEFKKRALTLEPDNVSMRSGLTSEANNLAVACLDAGDVPCAMEAITLGWTEMQRLLHDEPQNVGWSAGLSAMALHHGRVQLAAGEVAKALELLKMSEDALVARIASGKAGPAQIRRLAWTRLEQANALHQQGRVAQARTQADAAQQALEALVAKTPDDRDAWLLLGELGARRSQWGPAERAAGVALARSAYAKAAAMAPLAGRHVAHWNQVQT
jgi:tetratricopeptide (TPR) repeat protein